MNTQAQLMDYGLSEKEAKIYLFLVENTETTAPAVARNLSIPRATVYLVLESLKSRGLVSSTKKNNVARFSCESLNRLKSIAQDKVSLADVLIPQLRSLTAEDHFSPNTKLYVGKDGLKNVFDDILDTMKDKKIHTLYSITDSSIVKILPKYFPEWVRRREKLGVFTKMIGENEGANFPFVVNKLRDVKFLPENITFDCSIDIYGDKIACFSIKNEEVYCVIVESSTLAHTLTQLFNVVWASLPTPPNKPQ